MLLAGSAAAGGIALINSLGSVSGWVGPSVVGWLADLTLADAPLAGSRILSQPDLEAAFRKSQAIQE
jgi:hypothetical protein